MPASITLRRPENCKLEHLDYSAMDCSKWMKMLIEWFLSPNQRVNRYRTEVTSKTQTTQGFVKEKKTWWFMEPLINSINMTVEILNSKVMSTYFPEWVRLINREKKKEIHGQISNGFLTKCFSAWQLGSYRRLQKKWARRLKYVG